MRRHCDRGLIDQGTWSRNYIDWEIAAMLLDTDFNDRGGMIGNFLTSHLSFGEDEYDNYTTPPRLNYNNVEAGYTEVIRLGVSHRWRSKAG